MKLGDRLEVGSDALVVNSIRRHGPRQEDMAGYHWQSQPKRQRWDQLAAVKRWFAGKSKPPKPPTRPT